MQMSNNNFAIVSSFLPMRKNDAGLGITVLQKNSNVDDWKIIQQLDRQDASWMTFDPTHHFLYVCYSLRNATGKVYGRLEAYQINSETHLLTLINEIDVEDGPAHMSVSPDGKYLLIANYFHGDFVVRQLNSDGSIGPISDKIQDQGTGPNKRQEAAHPHSIIFDKAGEFIGVTDLGNDTISI